MDLVYPRACPVCREPLQQKGSYICKPCRRQLHYAVEPRCMKCGRPVGTEQTGLCPDCETRSYSFDGGFPTFLYDDIMQQAIGDFKFRNHRELGAFFAEEMAGYCFAALKQLGIQALVPVPVHPSRKRYRGYNQAEVLCDELSKRLGLPVYRELLVRTRKTVPQKLLNPTERLRNLEQAVAFSSEAAAMETEPGGLERIALVDDIFTTGSTAEACTRVLKRNGVGRVYILSIAIVPTRE